MKRKVTSRRLKRTCIYCDCNFNKGDVYYKKRQVYSDFEGVIATEFLVCPKCKYKQEQSKQRFYNFVDKCHHPIKTEVWDYIPGECVMQPDHTECVICGQLV